MKWTLNRINYYYKTLYINQHYLQCPPLILAPLVNMSKGSCEINCIVYPFYLLLKKFTKFQPIIEVKQLKVGRGISLWIMLSLFHVGHNYWHPNYCNVLFPAQQLWVFSYNAWEFGEHLIRDQRPFSSYRISPDPSDSQLHDGASSLQFTSLIFCRVQVRGQRQQW